MVQSMYTTLSANGDTSGDGDLDWDRVLGTYVTHCNSKQPREKKEFANVLDQCALHVSVLSFLYYNSNS